MVWLTCLSRRGEASVSAKLPDLMLIRGLRDSIHGLDTMRVWCITVDSSIAWDCRVTDRKARGEPTAFH